MRLVSKKVCIIGGSDVPQTVSKGICKTDVFNECFE